MSSSTTLAVPIFQSYNNSSHLPPTPSSSSSSFNTKAKVVRELSTQKYGSLSSTPYLESLNDSRPVTPSHSTISPNDDDESLYLLWTQELLKERGLTSDQDDNDDSSISDMSSVSSTDDDHAVDYYAVKQHKLFSSVPSSAYSHRASMLSHYSSTNEETSNNSTQNPISLFFRNYFSSCL